MQALVIMIDSIVETSVSAEASLFSVLLLQHPVFKKINLRQVDSFKKNLLSRVSTQEFPSVHQNFKTKLNEGFSCEVRGIQQTFPALSDDKLRILQERAESADDSLEKILTVMEAFMNNFLESSVVVGQTLAWSSSRVRLTIIDAFVGAIP